MPDGHDILDIATKIVEDARGEEQLEAFVVHEKTFQVKAYAGDVESVTSAEPRGAGVRVFDGDRVGFSYTTELSEQGLTDVIERARENARYASGDAAVAPAPAWEGEVADIPELFDADQPGTPVDAKVDFAVRLETATRTADARVKTVEEAVYSDSDTEVAIATSTGVKAAYRRTDAWCYSFAIAADADDTEVGFEFDLARGLAALDAEEVAAAAVRRATAVLGAKKIPSERMSVVFEPYTAAQFLGVVGSALTGEAVQKGRSLFAGKLGEGVANEALTLVDDGGLRDAPGAAPWDGEGVPTRRTEVIAEGALRSFLYDITSANREGRRSTGNAARAGFKSPPGPSPSNLALDPTGVTRDELLRDAGRALVVQDFHGVHSGANPVSGDFSVGATGRVWDGGAPGAPVKEVTIAAPMLDILAGIVAVADDRRWLPFGGSYGGATTLVTEMTVAGA